MLELHDIRGGRQIYDEHSVRDLMLADATAQDDHPCLFRPSCLLVDLTDVARDVNDQSWAAERVEINHVSDGTVCQRRTEDGDVVLENTVSDIPCQVVKDVYSLCRPSSTRTPRY